LAGGPLIKLQHPVASEDGLCYHHPLKRDYFGGYPLANHKSAEKRARQSIVRKARNSRAKAAVKTTEKNLTKAVEAKSKDVPELLKAYMKKAMSVAGKGTLSKKTISRKISRLSKRVHAAMTAASK
jgi:small subunit ribosomal protein S20